MSHRRLISALLMSVVLVGSAKSGANVASGPADAVPLCQQADHDSVPWGPVRFDRATEWNSVHWGACKSPIVADTMPACPLRPGSIQPTRQMY